MKLINLALIKLPAIYFFNKLVSATFDKNYLSRIEESCFYESRELFGQIADGA